MVLDGGSCKKGIESTIIGFVNGDPIVYRLGSISIEDIESVIGKIEIKNKKEIMPDAPGMLARHYAPTTKIILVDDVDQALKQYSNKKIGLLTFQDYLTEIDVVHKIVLSMTGDLDEATSNLYNAMHELDGLDLDIIIAQKLPDLGLGRSLNDRLQRATFSN